jgi:hypothetical protein
MTISGEELGVELYDLRQAGRISLPEVAAIYAQASRHMHNTSWQQEEGFDQQRNVVYEPNDHNVGFDEPNPEVPIFNDNGTAGYTATIEEGTLLGPVFGPWTSLRDTLQKYLGWTATSLVTAGRALEQIADAYAATDGAAGAELDELSQGLGEGPEVPEIMLPGDPHETVTEEHEISLPNPFGEDIPILDYETEEPAPEPTDPLSVH